MAEVCWAKTPGVCRSVRCDQLKTKRSDDHMTWCQRELSESRFSAPLLQFPVSDFDRERSIDF